MNEPETKNEATAGEPNERMVGAAVRAAYGVYLDNVVREPAVGPVEGEDADTAVAGASVGLSELCVGAGVVMSYLSILRL